MNKRRELRSAKEHRSAPAREVRVLDDAPGRFEAVVVTYNTIDDFNTRFRPGCFAESLRTRLPRITYGHDWLELIGRYVEYRDTDTELTLVGQLDDFDAVPRARQAYAQLRSGTIDQFSVGFYRIADEMVPPDDVEGRAGVVDIVTAGLDEAALVLAAAVPGTRLISVRSTPTAAPATVREDDVLMLAKKVAAGDLTHAEAKAALALLAETEPPEPDAAAGEPEPDPVAKAPAVDEPAPEPEPQTAEAPPEVTDAEIDAALAMADRSR